MAKSSLETIFNFFLYVFLFSFIEAARLNFPRIYKYIVRNVHISRFNFLVVAIVLTAESTALSPPAPSQIEFRASEQKKRK